MPNFVETSRASSTLSHSTPQIMEVDSDEAYKENNCPVTPSPRPKTMNTDIDTCEDHEKSNSPMSASKLLLSEATTNGLSGNADQNSPVSSPSISINGLTLEEPKPTATAPAAALTNPNARRDYSVYLSAVNRWCDTALARFPLVWTICRCWKVDLRHDR